MPPPDCPPERPIAPLIPAALPQPRPEPAPVGDLPPPVPVRAAPAAVYVIAHLNASGQISVRTLLSALGWASGDRIAVIVQHGCIVAVAAGGGSRTVGAGGSLLLPVAARRMCAIPDRSAVLLAALTRPRLLVVHPIAILGRHLYRRHSKIVAGRRGSPG